MVKLDPYQVCLKIVLSFSADSENEKMAAIFFVSHFLTVADSRRVATTLLSHV